jgi:hypothetical protein
MHHKLPLSHVLVNEKVPDTFFTLVYHYFPKLGVVCDVEAHLILAAQDGRGPKPDVADFRPRVAAEVKKGEKG